MTIENLNCFVLLAEELNFTRVAEKAHISQSTMSRRIDNVEAELGTRLFFRDQHVVTLTDAGKALYQHIAPILTGYSDIVTRVQNIGNGLPDTIRVGIGLYEGSLLFPLLREFVLRFPITKIDYIQYGYWNLLNELVHERLDLIITSDQFLGTIPKEILEKVLLYDSPWLLVLHRSNSLAKQEIVEMRQLHTQNIITMHAGNLEKVRSEFSHDFSLASIDYVNTNETKLMLISTGRGVGFVPSFVDVSCYPDLVTRPLTPIYRPRKYYAVCKKGCPNQYVQSCMEMLAQHYTPHLWSNKFPELTEGMSLPQELW